MNPVIDYYFSIGSPWTYLGHQRFSQIVRDNKATVNVRPVDLGKVFPVSGGLPLPKRAPQRIAYRTVELKRWSDYLGLPMNLSPKFFPIPGDLASRLIIAVGEKDGFDAAMRLSGAVFSTVWAREGNGADEATLAGLLNECGLDAARLEQSKAPEWQAKYEANTQKAIEDNVFGAPFFVIDGEMFWGQDRLDFVERKLKAMQAA